MTREAIEAGSSRSGFDAESTDAVILLHRFVALCDNGDLYAAVDTKIKTNRVKIWQRAHDGTGSPVAIPQLNNNLYGQDHVGRI